MVLSSCVSEESKAETNDGLSAETRQPYITEGEAYNRADTGMSSSISGSYDARDEAGFSTPLYAIATSSMTNDEILTSACEPSVSAAAVTFVYTDICIRSTRSSSSSSPLNTVGHVGDRPTNMCEEAGSHARRRRQSRRRNRASDITSSRKWRPIPLSETGFGTSLLPRRPSSSSPTADDVELQTAADVTSEQNEVVGDEGSGLDLPTTLPPAADNERLDLTVVLVCHTTSAAVTDDQDKAVWLDCLRNYDAMSDTEDDYGLEDRGFGEDWESSAADDGLSVSRQLRTKKKCRIEKARRQVKTSHCRSVKNVVHGVTLYVNHRVLKRMTMAVEPTSHRPCELTLRRIDSKLLTTTRGTPTARSSTAPAVPAPARKRPSPASHGDVIPAGLIYAVDNANADSALSADVLSLLVALQHRDLSPEDYELLLRLDDRVQPRTVDDARLAALPVAEVTDVDLCAADEDLQQRAEMACGVCLEAYEVGQRRKLLPCGHAFHESCIDAWLRQSSTNCPLDGLEVFT